MQQITLMTLSSVTIPVTATPKWNAAFLVHVRKVSVYGQNNVSVETEFESFIFEFECSTCAFQIQIIQTIT